MRTSFSLALFLSLAAGCPGTHAPDDVGTDAPPVDAILVYDVPTVDGGPPPSDAGRVCNDAFDARGEGGCEAVLGVVWTGSFCASISGCSCVGADCDLLFETMDACVATFRTCPRSCGGLTPFGSPTCPDDEFCDYPEGSFCGGDDSQGRCTARPTDCPEPGGVPVCGCDGTDYLTECSANLAGTDAARFGSCTSG